ncbi:MAG: hypothetical protein U5K76_13110 [Woeseiaceae bacterium]|nr:hypothetical protein [Woeseiaceae bacterium]
MRASGTRQQAQVDFRQADARAAGGDAAVATHGNLQSAAEGRAVDGGDHGLLHSVQPHDDIREVRCLRRLAEFADVGSGDERAAVAAQHARVDAAVAVQRLKACHEPGPHRLRQGIDGRVIDGDHGDSAATFDFDDAHGLGSCLVIGEKSPALCKRVDAPANPGRLDLPRELA